LIPLTGPREAKVSAQSVTRKFTTPDYTRYQALASPTGGVKNAKTPLFLGVFEA
jgi:hypothetical protein